MQVSKLSCLKKDFLICCVSKNDEEIFMDVLKRIFCGIIVGIANIIPGVSGGTMMVTFGI